MPLPEAQATEVSTEVTDVLTLLVKSRGSIPNGMGVRVTRVMALVALAFTCPL